MSGGHFDYKQFAISDIAESLDKAIRNNKIKDEYGFCRDLSKETIKEFKKVYLRLNRVKKEVMCIDWLLSGDDSEETYLQKVKEQNENRTKPTTA